MIDWVTPEALVLSLVGDLDAPSSQTIGARLRQLLAQWPGIAVTVDLAGVASADKDALEGLCLDLVANRYRGGALNLACPSAACIATLKQLNIDFIPRLAPVRSLAGVTA
jgi:anti-anti-sigma regulatory factor